MAAPAPVPPHIFKAMLEKHGFRVAAEDAYNWVLYKEDAPRPIITIPKKGKVISLEIMMRALNQLKIDDGTYFELLKQVTGKSR